MKVIILSIMYLYGAAALNPLDILNVVQLFPTDYLSNIPQKITSKIKELDSSRNGITTSYKFPVAYTSTLYKDFYQKTTLVNVFPTVETIRPKYKYQSIDVQNLESSTTLLYEQMNSTTQYAHTPMLNSTLVYPTTVPIQETLYVAPEYQHETLVYSTKINITELTSTQLMNFTAVTKLDNDLPFV